MYAALLPPGAIAETLRETFDDPGYAAVIVAVAVAAPPAFAFRAGAMRRIADLGILGHVTMSCASLGEVAEIWKSYADGAGELVRLEWSIFSAPDGVPMWRLGFVPAPLLPRKAANFCVDEMCAAFFAYAREITGADFAEFAVNLPHSRDPSAAYSAYFPGAVRFDQPEASIVGPAAALDLPIHSHDPETFDVLIEHFRMQKGFGAAAGPMRLLLYDHLIRRRGRPTKIDAIAAALKTSVRTLSRKLAAEGTSYGEVLDDFRRTYALALIENGVLQPKQIAHAIGFQHENCLRRAFRRWTGRPIGAWRRDDRSGDVTPES